VIAVYELSGRRIISPPEILWPLFFTASLSVFLGVLTLCWDVWKRSCFSECKELRNVVLEVKNIRKSFRETEVLRMWVQLEKVRRLHEVLAVEKRRCSVP
jgi:hypothetical protein